MLRSEAGGEVRLTGVGREGARQAEPKELPKFDGFKDGVGATVEVTNSIEAFDGHG